MCSVLLQFLGVAINNSKKMGYKKGKHAHAHMHAHTYTHTHTHQSVNEPDFLRGNLCLLSQVNKRKEKE